MPEREVFATELNEQEWLVSYLREAMKMAEKLVPESALLAAEARVREVEAERDAAQTSLNVWHDSLTAMTAERDALVPLIRAVPDHLCCEDFDHRPPDRHRSGEPCQPYERYRTALTQARAILAREGA